MSKVWLPILLAGAGWLASGCGGAGAPDDPRSVEQPPAGISREVYYYSSAEFEAPIGRVHVACGGTATRSGVKTKFYQHFDTDCRTGAESCWVCSPAGCGYGLCIP